MTSREERRARARLALDGLSVGDAFGQRFFVSPSMVESLIASRALPAPPWYWTDDTAMALSVYEVLLESDGIDPDRLAERFARRYVRDPRRGYGGTAHGILQEIATGTPWRVAARSVFDGAGSMGNGGAMRSAPVGAFFHDDLGRVIEHARASAEPTHAHPEGQAGAIAVAIAAALACAHADPADLLRIVVDRTPPGPTRDGLAKAHALPFDADPKDAAERLGSGALVVSADTVPFSLWCAARHLASFEDALWTTVSGLGDRDTTCAIVGGIVALAVGALPRELLDAREPLDSTLTADQRNAELG